MDENTVPATAWLEYASGKRSYFYNWETKETTWDIPADYFAWKEGLLKSYLKTTNWKKAVDKKEKVYYYDKITKETQWDVPTDVADYEANLLKFNLKRYVPKKRKLEDASPVVLLKALPVVPLFEKVSSPVSPESAVVDDDIVKKIGKFTSASDIDHESIQRIDSNTDPTISTTKYERTVEPSSNKKEKEIFLRHKRDDCNSDSDKEEDYLAAGDYVIQATPLYTLEKKVFNHDDTNNANVEDNNANDRSFNENSITNDDDIIDDDCYNGNETIDIDTDVADINNDIDPYTQETDRDRDQSQSQSQFTQENEEEIVREKQEEHGADDRTSLNIENSKRKEDYDLYGQDQYTQDQDWEMDQEREREMQLLRDSNQTNVNQERTLDLGYYEDQEGTPNLRYDDDQERTPDLGYENYNEQDRTPNGSEENFDNYEAMGDVVSQTNAEGKRSELAVILRI